MTTRRNVLTILGLATAASPALATDDVVDKHFDPYRLKRVDPQRMAMALERLATEIRHGTVDVAKFVISSEIDNPDEWLKQTLTLDIEIRHRDG